MPAGAAKARGAQSAGARTRTRRGTAEAKAGEPGVEAAAARIRELNERFIVAGKGAGRGTLDVARKLLKRAHHTLRELGDDALQPA